MIKILLYGNGMCSLYESLQEWLLSRKLEIILLSHEIGLTNDIDFLLLLFRTWWNRLYKFKPQNKIETYKKHDFDTDKLFMKRLRDKLENTKLSIIIKYILNSNEQLYI